MRGGPGWVGFHDGKTIEFDQPKNTLDPRYRDCTDHHTACICREAEWSEEVEELTSEWFGARKALAEVCNGHEADTCMCTGCQVLRKLGLTFLAVMQVRS